MKFKTNLTFKDLNIKEIKNKILELKKELVLLKIKQYTKQKVKLNEIQQIKYQIVRLLTLATTLQK